MKRYLEHCIKLYEEYIREKENTITELKKEGKSKRILDTELGILNSLKGSLVAYRNMYGKVK